MRFDSKFKDNSWRSRTSGNLNYDVKSSKQLQLKRPPL